MMMMIIKILKKERQETDRHLGYVLNVIRSLTTGQNNVKQITSNVFSFAG